MNKNVLLLAITASFSATVCAQDVQNVNSTYAEKFSSALKLNKQPTPSPSPETSPSTSASTQSASQVVSDRPEKPQSQVSTSNPSKEEVVEVTKTVTEKETIVQPKVAKKHKAVPVSKAVDITTTTVTASVVELPKNVPLEEIGKFLKPMSTDDITISVLDNDSDTVKFKLIDDRSGQPITQNNIKNRVSTLSANSSLVKFRFSEENIGQDGVIVSPKVSGGNCQALYVTFQLNDSKALTTKTIVLDKLDDTLKYNGESCKLANIDANETTFYTNSGYIVNLAFDKRKSSNGHVAFTANMSKDGRAFSSHDTVAYAISKDMMKAYKLNVTHDARGAFFGSRVDQEIPSGIYYIVLGFSYEGKPDYVTSILNVN